MARYGQQFKERLVARLMPPECASLQEVSDESGISVVTLERWRNGATQALADPEDMRATPQATRADRHRIRELGRDLSRKNQALAETTALLVLAKKLSAILPVSADA